MPPVRAIKSGHEQVAETWRRGSRASDHESVGLVDQGEVTISYQLPKTRRDFTERGRTDFFEIPTRGIEPVDRAQ